MKMRSEWTRESIIQALALGGMVITVVLLLLLKLPAPWPRALEGVLYLSGIVLLLAQTPLRRVLKVLRPTQRWILGSLIGVTFLTQMASIKQQKTFPFIPWKMYTRSLPEPPRFYEYVGICEDQSELLIPAAHVFRTQHRTLPWRLMSARQAMEAMEDGPVRKQVAKDYRLLLSSLVRRFNEQHPDTVVERVRLVECTMTRPAAGRELKTSRRDLAEFTIE